MNIPVKIYVNHAYEEVLTEEEYKTKVAEETAEIYKDKEALAEWLDDNFDEIDIWDMTPEQRAKAEADWAEYSKSHAEEKLDDDGWCQYELML